MPQALLWQPRRVAISWRIYAIGIMPLPVAARCAAPVYCFCCQSAGVRRNEEPLACQRRNAYPSRRHSAISVRAMALLRLKVRYSRSMCACAYSLSAHICSGFCGTSIVACEAILHRHCPHSTLTTPLSAKSSALRKSDYVASAVPGLCARYAAVELAVARAHHPSPQHVKPRAAPLRERPSLLSKYAAHILLGQTCSSRTCKSKQNAAYIRRF